jgi:hypothetical protein
MLQPSFEQSKSTQLETPDIPPSLEVWLNKELPAQYINNLKYLQETGQLSLLSTGRMGISAKHSIDCKEYPLPYLSQIKQAILKDEKSREFYAKKIEQGFKSLNITPFAKHLEILANEYGEDIKQHFNEGKLFTADADPYHPKRKLQPLDLDINEPIWVNDDFKQADSNGKLKYHPKSFDSNHGGQTKSEILTNPSTGFEITLFQQNPIIPANIADKTPRQYLALTQTKDKKSLYFGTRGQTPEGALNRNRQVLYQTNQVLGDFAGNDKANYCVGAYLDGTNDVPNLDWDRKRQRADLDTYYPGDPGSFSGFCLAVGVLC